MVILMIVLSAQNKIASIGIPIARIMKNIATPGNLSDVVIGEEGGEGANRIFDLDTNFSLLKMLICALEFILSNKVPKLEGAFLMSSNIRLTLKFSSSVSENISIITLQFVLHELSISFCN